MLGIGVIGYGYWGPNIVRNLAETPGACVRHVVDLREEQIAKVRKRYPGIQTGADPGALIDDPGIDAIVVASPTSTHFELAMRALQAGKHVLIEKPMVTTVREAERLVAEAARRSLTLMVDHTYVYTPAVQRIRELIVGGELGNVLYYDATRINLGLFQHDVDVIWDLAVHDVSILAYLLDAAPIAVSATGQNHLSNIPQNVAYLTMFFAGKLIAHVNVNWLSPVKIRRTIIGGSRKMLVYDDLEPSDKIKVYESGLRLEEDPEQVRRMLIGHRTGDMWAPALPPTEALSAVAAHFVDCASNGRPCITSGEKGLAVVRTLAAASRSVQLQGHAIDVATLEPCNPS